MGMQNCDVKEYSLSRASDGHCCLRNLHGGDVSMAEISLQSGSACDCSRTAPRSTDSEVMSDRPSGPRSSVGPEYLAEQMTRLKSVETAVRQRLPTPTDISAEQSAQVKAV